MIDPFVCPNCGEDDFDDDVTRERIGENLYITTVCTCKCGTSWSVAESFSLTGITIATKSDDGDLKLTHIASEPTDERPQLARDEDEDDEDTQPIEPIAKAQNEGDKYFDDVGNYGDEDDWDEDEESVEGDIVRYGVGEEYEEAYRLLCEIKNPKSIIEGDTIPGNSVIASLQAQILAIKEKLDRTTKFVEEVKTEFDTHWQLSKE